MTDFGKLKIPFALALLAAMFAVKPIVDTYANVMYTVLNIPVTLGFVYAIFCSLLGATVYFYAIGLIGERPVFVIANKVGHITYAVALITPPFFILLYPVAILGSVLVDLWKTPFLSKVIEYVFSFILGMVGTIVSKYLFKAFSQKDKSDKIEKLEDRENNLLIRAKQLYQNEYFDLSAVESWKAIEVALTKILFNLGVKSSFRSTQDIMEEAKKRNILSEREIDELNSLRRIRNDAVHSATRITSAEAHNALDVANKIIAAMQKGGDTCYFCNKYFSATDLEIDDITGAAVCRACRKKNPNWQQDLTEIGMDP